MKRGNSMIDMIVWSKNRAMQLDLLLRTTREKAIIIKQIYIIYTHSSWRFEHGYEKLMKNTFGDKQITWVKEISFREDFIKGLEQLKTEYVLPSNDDNVFINKFDLCYPLNDDEVAYSLRLNPRVNFCQAANLQIPPPFFIPPNDGNGSYRWDWTKCNPLGDWGYPHPADSNVYKRQYFINLLKRVRFKGLGEFENAINTNRPKDKPYMCCFEKSKLINICNNRVSNTSPCPHGNVTAEELNDRYLYGQRINPRPFYKMEKNQCHIEAEYQYE